MTPLFDPRRLEPHDGDLGLASWVACEACVHGLTTLHDRAAAGWFAIPAGTPHQIDPVTRWHLHDECAAVLRDEADRRDAQVTRYLSGAHV